jgi:predicted ABC-type ATPase
MPTLYVLGGANGVGKTTWYQLGVENSASVTATTCRQG